jgi:signal transduction histidine kinase/CheY-like chemotaxis protein/ligand-binding sensor domain-containing protein/AraC-like DNA-binding protein
MTYRRLLLLFCACLVSATLSAQAYIVKVKHYGVEEGLSHREVNEVFQDSRGFIWIGTPNGLNRFDGYAFRLFTKEKDGLAFNDIRNICEDADGWLWLTGPSGKSNVCLFHPKRGEVRTFAQKFGSTKPFSEDNLSDEFYKDDDGAVWFTLKQTAALARYHPSTGFQQFPIPGFQHFDIVYFSAQHTIWVIGDKNTLLEVDRTGHILQRFDHQFPVRIRSNSKTYRSGFYYASEPVSLPEIPATAYYVDRQGKRQEVAPQSLALGLPFMPQLLYQINDDGLILSQNRLIQSGKGIVSEWKFDFHDAKDGSWRAFFMDRGGKIWVGDNFGMYTIQVKKNRFQSFFYKAGVSRNVGNSCRGIVATKEKLWVNLEKFGLFEYDRLHNTTTLLKRNASSWGHFALDLEPDGTLDAGFQSFLFRYPSNGGNTGQLLPVTDSKGVWAFRKMPDGKTVLGTEKGLLYFNPATSQVEPFTAYNEFGPLADGHVVLIAPDRHNNFWICASNGLYKLDPVKGITARYWPEGKGAFFLPVDRFFHFYQDEEGVFWFATPSGLLQTPSAPGTGDPVWDAGKSHLFTRADGLSDDVIYAVYEDHRHHLWLSTGNGIVQFDKQTLHSRTFLTEDGISDLEFNRLAHYRDQNGVIYFGSLNGITAFNPDDFIEKIDTIAPIPLEITAFQQFDGVTNHLINRVEELLRTNEIVLHPDDRFFNLEFALLTYQDVHDILYAWKIEGLDKDWTYQHEPFIRIGQLPYGNHTLRIRGQAGNGLWSKNELAVNVHVLRPFYLQIWFVLLMLALVAGGIWAFIRWRTWEHVHTEQYLQSQIAKAVERIERDKQTIEKQAGELRQLDEVKSRLFANVSHELRTPLTLMLGPIGRVLKNAQLNAEHAGLLSIALDNGKQLLDLVHKILNLSKLQANDIALKEAPVTLAPFVRQVVSKAEDHARQHSIHLSLLIKTEANLHVAFDAEKVETILGNLLSNAIRFTNPNGKVNLTMEDLGNALRFTVTDTGRGIHADDLPHIFERFYQSKQPGAPIEGGMGIGLALSMELVKLMQGKLWATSEPGRGSQFFFELPRKEVFGFIPQETVANGVAATELTQSDTLPTEPLTAPRAVIDQLPTILVVEDNLVLLQYIRLLLSGKYNVVTVEHGQEALDYLSQSGNPLPDMILSDIMMPVMDGYQLLEVLKTHHIYRQIPVIMLTARADMADKLKALRIGVDDYMIKPFDEEELMTRVESLLQNDRERKLFAIQNNETFEAGNPTEAPGSPRLARFAAEDQAWLTQLEQIVQSRLSDFDLTADSLAIDLAMSRAQFFRQIKKQTGLTPAQYIDEARFQFARQLLETGKVNSVKAAAYSVGFRQIKHFSQAFRERFGKLPSNYLK